MKNLGKFRCLIVAISEQKALHDLKNDENIEIKSADKTAVVVEWVREDYIIEATW